ncbi:hemin uptake protein HemP [Candidatus Nitrotoga sp. HW29]|uniref:hemin uptake protein HemP n=1 Tax=Candidatus Nitrotoga sp. HW29 TaxID=2886963 RepID=UPI001EF180E9|nr:hemin uptake protein HemP [Candidatus Nitrotoga sp. HW29]
MNGNTNTGTTKTRIPSSELFGDSDALLIEHAERWYLLRKVASGGLLLTRWTDSPRSSIFRTQSSPISASKQVRHRIGLFDRIWLGD